MRSKLQAAVASVLLATVTPVIGFSVTGCATWISNFKKDPIGQIQNVIQIVQTIISAGTIVFGEVKTALPADEQAKAQADWDAAILKVNGTVAALQAAVQVAVDAKQPNPNLSQLVTDLVKAIDELQTVISLYNSHLSASGKLAAKAPPKGYDLFLQQVALLKKQSGAVSASTQ
jgi:hypothetical protein